jgi:hypothetical protein
VNLSHIKKCFSTLSLLAGTTLLPIHSVIASTGMHEAQLSKIAGSKSSISIRALYNSANLGPGDLVKSISVYVKNSLGSDRYNFTLSGYKKDGLSKKIRQVLFVTPETFSESTNRVYEFGLDHLPNFTNGGIINGGDYDTLVLDNPQKVSVLSIALVIDNNDELIRPTPPFAPAPAPRPPVDDNNYGRDDGHRYPPHDGQSGQGGQNRYPPYDRPDRHGNQQPITGSICIARDSGTEEHFGGHEGYGRYEIEARRDATQECRDYHGSCYISSCEPTYGVYIPRRHPSRDERNRPSNPPTQPNNPPSNNPPPSNPTQPTCTEVAQTPVACAQYAGQYGIPATATSGYASWNKNSCSQQITYTGGCTEPACVEVAQTPVACAQYAGQYGIPATATSGYASWNKNSCSQQITYTGGCYNP